MAKSQFSWLKFFSIFGLYLCLHLGTLPILAAQQKDPKPPSRRRVLPHPPIPIPDPSENRSKDGEKPDKDNDQEPEMKVQSVRIDEVHLTTADMTVTVEIYNPHSALTISNLSFWVKLNDVQSGEGRYPDEIKLPGKSAITLILPLTVDLTALPGVGVEGVLGGIRLDYQVDSEFDVSFMIFKKRVKKTMTGTVPVQAVLPRITLPRISLPNIIFP